MKKVTAFVGSGRKRHTYDAVSEFLGMLEARGDIETEIVRLGDYHLEICRGCRVCFDKGEENCPLADDRDKLIAKIDASDGVVFASPNYSFQVSGLTKVFFDRLGCLMHRPRWHGKAYTSIVMQGFYGGGKIVKYMSFVGMSLGFDVVKGTVAVSLEPVTEKAMRDRDKRLAKQAERFVKALARPADHAPSLFQLLAFRMARTSVRSLLGEGDRDYDYYSERGLFDAEYYYPTRLSAPKRALGRVFDAYFSRAFKPRNA